MVQSEKKSISTARDKTRMLQNYLYLEDPQGNGFRFSGLSKLRDKPSCGAVGRSLFLHELLLHPQEYTRA